MCWKKKTNTESFKSTVQGLCVRICKSLEKMPRRRKRRISHFETLEFQGQRNWRLPHQQSWRQWWHLLLNQCWVYTSSAAAPALTLELWVHAHLQMIHLFTASLHPPVWTFHRNKGENWTTFQQHLLFRTAIPFTGSSHLCQHHLVRSQNCISCQWLLNHSLCASRKVNTITE